MNCANVELILCKPTNRRRAIDRYLVARHSARCSHCAQFARDAASLEVEARAWRSDAISESLPLRIRETLGVDASGTAGASRPSARTLRKSWIGVFAAAAAVVIAIGVMLLPRGQSGAATAQEMLAAVARIKNVHISEWSCDYTSNGVEHRSATLRRIEDQWYGNNCWRKEGIYGSRLIIGYSTPRIIDGYREVGTFYRYDSRRHRVISMGESGNQISDFTLSGLTGGWYVDPTVAVTVVHQGVENGRVVTELSFSDTAHSPGYRDVCWVDDGSDLPIRIDRQQFQTQSIGWTTVSRYLLQFNTDMPASIFDPSTLKDEGWSPPWEK